MTGAWTSTDAGAKDPPTANVGDPQAYRYS